MGIHFNSVDAKLLRQIRKMRPGKVFVPADLSALGSRTAVASALSRHARDGTIRRIAQGLYQIPRRHSTLGELSPSIEEVARALAREARLKLQPSGAYAANLLGLSDQVPLKVVYWTNGTPRRIRLGKQEIVLRRTTPRNMAAAGRISGLVIQAFRYLGRRHVDETVIRKLSRRLGSDEKATLVRDLHLAPAWIATLMRRIAKGPDA